MIFLVAVVGIFALSLAWFSRNERTDFIIFSGFACLFIGVACAAVFTRASWVTWMLAGLAIVGTIAIVWAVVMATAIANHYNAMAVRNVELDQPFFISSAARVAQVGPLTIRHKKTATLPDNTHEVTLAIINSAPHHSITEVILQKGKASSISIAEVYGYRIELLDVSSAEANKLALYKSTLKASIVAPDND